MIEAYSFGSIVVNGRSYSSDIIIYPDGRVQGSWWRKQGHSLCVDDIEELIAAKPEIIIVGAGASGLMRPEKTLEDFLAEKGVKLICQPSREAVQTFNQIHREKVTGACFHLTC